MGLGGFVLKGKGGTKKAFFPLGATQSNVNKRSLNLKG